MKNNFVFDFMGLVRIQVIGANEKDLALVRKLVGVPPKNYAGKEVDIIIRFAENLTPAKMNCLGIKQFGFTDKEFFLLDSSKGEVVAQIPINQIGEKCEIVCRRGINKIPLFDEILKVTLLQKNVLSLHASAIEYEQKGMVFMGWARGGKTSALLAFIQEGAKFVADDWVMYDLEKDHVFGFPGKLSVSDNHLQQMPNKKGRVDYNKRVFLWCKKALVCLINIILGVFKIAILQKFTHKLDDKLRIDLYPEDLLTHDEIVQYTMPRKFMLMTSHNQKKYVVRQITAGETVDIFIHANEREFVRLHETYQAYCFAFPGKKNFHIENRINTEKQLLRKALEGKETLRIFHPYPISFRAFTGEVK